ncbi:SDR family NAD(P)-dependent oxidoreductase [Teredinibacter haidensis]|uniref:SDR family NAD(P)-dependent oxidoreductase n=1 Tax=Teredinibacter haidensis TaxID=2731755 RepID=UPI000948FBD5|nr:SDR family NAD(P)-dependent oxidoreductase [Teredinibacter haidensis]
MRKTVVVTGCSSGIGRYAAKRLVTLGYKVIATVRNKADVQPLQLEGVDHVVLLDLAESESIQFAVKKILTIADGQVYALFNNAAYGQPGAVEDLTRDSLRKQFEVNLFGTHELTIRLLPSMLKMEDARIIQNSSVLGFVAMPFRGAYNASKFALEGLTDTLRLELKSSPVKISIIEPGPILSRFRQNALKALEDNVDIQASRHAEKYEAAQARLRRDGAAVPFTLGPDAVFSKLIHALESKNPKKRYRVTLPTYLMAVLRVVMPTGLMDKILIAGGQ